MSSPDCKRQKLAEMSNVSPKKECGTQTDDVTITASVSSKKSIVDKDAKTFKAVASLDGFVDRTMLIQALLRKRGKKVMIFAPSKFGKTINLDMIRLFCDIEDKNTKTKEDVAKDPTMLQLLSNPSENLKVLLRQFNDKKYDECLILKQEAFVIQHFGRHPVILFDFKDCQPRDCTQALFECAKRVRKSYLENYYLVNSKQFHSDNSLHALLKHTCKDWCSYDDDDLQGLIHAQIIGGLKYLVKSLRIHWGRKPVFLVDEYDKPCVAAMERVLSKSQIIRIVTAVRDVVCSLLKQSEDELQLQAALLTGISRIISPGSSSMDDTTPIYFLDDARFSKYYGLTTKEVESLAKKFFVSEGDAAIKTIISNIKTYYNGYYQHYSYDEKVKSIEYARYCIFSVLSYMEQRNENKNNHNLSFWTDGGLRTEGGLMGKLVSILKKSNIIMSAVQTLLYDHSGTIAIMYERQLYDEFLLGIYREEIRPSSDTTFSFLLQRGFLAHNPEKPEEEVPGGWKIRVRIPNHEIKKLYYEMFKSYHATLPKPVISAFTSCGEFFKSLPTLLESSMLNPTKFQEDLNKLCANLKCIFSLMNCQSEASVCSHMVTILKLYAGYQKGKLNYTVQYLDDDKPRNVCVDVWGKHGNFALILEAKYNDTANGEPGNIGYKTESSMAAAEDIVTLLPGKEHPENDSSCSKAGTGRNLEVLKSPEIKNYLLMGLAVDGDGTTHMLVFPNSHDWKNVIAVNPENHVAELISTHLKSK